MSHKISFTLDGKKVEAEKGLTIWEIANGQGIKIPHLCHKPTPAYRPDGNCLLSSYNTGITKLLHYDQSFIISQFNALPHLETPERWTKRTYT